MAGSTEPADMTLAGRPASRARQRPRGTTKATRPGAATARDAGSGLPAGSGPASPDPPHDCSVRGSIRPGPRSARDRGRAGARTRCRLRRRRTSEGRPAEGGLCPPRCTPDSIRPAARRSDGKVLPEHKWLQAGHRRDLYAESHMNVIDRTGRCTAARPSRPCIPHCHSAGHERARERRTAERSRSPCRTTGTQGTSSRRQQRRACIWSSRSYLIAPRSHQAITTWLGIYA